MNFPTSQTPPPPSPNPLAPPAAPEPVGPGLSEPQRLINVFIAPSKTFEDLKRNPSWWVPWLVATIISLVAAFVTVQKVDIVRMAEHRMEQSKLAQQRLEQLPPAQRDQAIRFQATILKVTFYLRPLFGLLGGLIGAAILMAVFNFLHAAEIPFSRALAVFFYATLPGIIKLLLLCLSLFLSNDPGGIDPYTNPVATNPGFFMDPQGNKFLYLLASSLDVIGIWITILLGIGFAKASSNRKLTVSTALTTMFVIFAILAVGGAAIASAL